MTDRNVLIRGCAFAVIAVSTPLALARPKSVVGVNDACASPERESVAYQCCPRPNSYCTTPWGEGPYYMKYWDNSSQNCPGF